MKRSRLDLSDPHAANAFKVYVTWCIRNDILDRNPIAGERAVDNQRDRVLDDEELKAIYNYENPPFSTIVKLLMLTGQRRNEIAWLHSDWIGDVITIPSQITKNKKSHAFPFGEMTTFYLKGKGYLFCNKKGTTSSDFSKSKAQLDSELKIPRWTLHDIRRTFSTIHARIGTPIHVTEASLNHVSGSRAGIVRVYQRYDYMKEIRAAVLAWEREVSRIVSP